MKDIYQQLNIQLKKRKQDETFRSLNCLEGVDFWSNDYLGLAKIVHNNNEYKGGSTGSRLISGNYSLIENVETKIATFFESQSAVIFNSGYDANIGLLACIPQKNDVVIYDQYIHASMRDGIRLSLAKSYSFAHQNYNDLEKKIRLVEKQNKTIFVCIESLYSMGGTIAPLPEILNICQKYNAYLIVDEAHAGGIYGTNGQGIIHALNLHKHPKLFARIFTFGKAFGKHGATIVGHKLLKEYIINYCRTFIYTTVLPPQAIKQIEQCIDISEMQVVRNKLLKNILYFYELAIKNDIKLLSSPNSPIQMIKVGNRQQTVEKAMFLQNNKLLVKAIISPTVHKTNEAIRICLHAFNTKDELKQLAKLLK